MTTVRRAGRINAGGRQVVRVARALRDRAGMQSSPAPDPRIAGIARIAGNADGNEQLYVVVKPYPIRSKLQMPCGDAA